LKGGSGGELDKQYFPLEGEGNHIKLFISPGNGLKIDSGLAATCRELGRRWLR